MIQNSMKKTERHKGRLEQIERHPSLLVRMSQHHRDVSSP